MPEHHRIFGIALRLQVTKLRVVAQSRRNVVASRGKT
jgi:hypothetical protein